MRLCIVTCTGGRPELFELCKRWVRRQTRQPDLWLVCSDVPGETERDYPDLPLYAVFKNTPKRPESFIAVNWSEPAWALTWALQQVPQDHAAVVMEDDDLYFAHHCEVLMQKIERGALLAYGDEVWKFNLPLQKWSYRDGDRPTEGCVGIHPTGIGYYQSALRVEAWNDRANSEWWDPGDGVYSGYTKLDIKGVGYGLPGRAGATNQHVPTHKKARIMRPDPGNRKFRQFAGRDADAYLSLVRPYQVQ